MDAVEVTVIGRGSEEHVCELPRRGAAADGRHERAFGSLGVLDIDEPAEPGRSRAASGARPGSGSSAKCGGSVAESDATSASPWIERKGPYLQAFPEVAEAGFGQTSTTAYRLVELRRVG